MLMLIRPFLPSLRGLSEEAAAVVLVETLHENVELPAARKQKGEKGCMRGDDSDEKRRQRRSCGGGGGNIRSRITYI